MRARIWDDRKREYDTYKLPEGASKYESNMNKIVSCACCGKKIIYGNTYTSHKIHDQTGFGYAVCGECYFDRKM